MLLLLLLVVLLQDTLLDLLLRSGLLSCVWPRCHQIPHTPSQSFRARQKKATRRKMALAQITAGAHWQPPRTSSFVSFLLGTHLL